MAGKEGETMMAMSRRWIVVLSCVTLFAGCGAANAIGNARASLDRAKAAGAESGAPEDYYMAVEYFKAAEHEAGEGDASRARKWANASKDHSDRAIRKVGGGAK